MKPVIPRQIKKESKSLLFALKIIIFVIFVSLCQPAFAQNQEKNKATLFVSPHLETVLVGSTFDVSIFLDTRGNSINTVELNLKFSPERASAGLFA